MGQDRLPVNRPIVLANADVTMTASCEDLLAFYVERGVQRVTPWGWDTGIVYLEGDIGIAEDSSASGDAKAGAHRRCRRSTAPAAAAPAPTSRRPASTSPTW